MVKFEYKGKTYLRYNDEWVNEHYEIAPLAVKADLDKMYADSLVLDSYTTQELVRLADTFKGNESYYLAAKHYKEALMRGTIEECRFIYPRLTACLRKMNRAQEAVEMLTLFKQKYGLHMVPPVLLTSVAAAFCDLKQYDDARKCYRMAVAKMNGNVSPELMNVKKRIEKEEQERKKRNEMP